MNKLSFALTGVLLSVLLFSFACHKKPELTPEQKKAGLFDEAYNRQMHEVIKRVLKEDLIGIDVGCYKGEILAAMIQAAPKAKHIAFEPIPALYNELKKKFAGQNADIIQMAVGEKKGVTEFTHVVSNEAYSGFKERTYARKDEKIEKIQVNVGTLDELVAVERQVGLIKIDVEGAELLVLKGGRKLIGKHKPVIIFEHGQGSSEFYKIGPEDIYKLLNTELGLKISLMKRWLDGKPALTRKEFLSNYYDRQNYNYIAYP